MASPSGGQSNIRPRRAGRFATILGSATIDQVVYDGEISRERAREVFVGMAKNAGARDPGDRDELHFQLAAVYATGTSAERVMSEVGIEIGGDFVSMMDVERDVFEGLGENARRRFCRSYRFPDPADPENDAPFADLVFEVIADQPELRRRMANMNGCNEDMAPYSFDFAEKVSAKLTNAQRRFINDNKFRRVGVSRPDFISGTVSSEAYHVEKSLPSANKKEESFNSSARVNAMFGN